MPTVWIMDTCVLCEFIRVPGMDQHHAEINAEFKRRFKAGDRFVIPVTAVVETGNHIANANGDRRAAAKRLHDILEAARDGRVPFIVNSLEWGGDVLGRLLGGDSTGETFVDLAGAGRMGGGDIAILVERDLLRNRSAGLDVRIWTLEAEMGAYA